MRPNLTVLRSAIGPMLTETGTVKRPTGNVVYDPVTQTEIEETIDVYEGPLLIQPRAASNTTVEVGGRTASVAEYDLTLPAETPVEINDLVRLTSAPTDPSLADVVFIVTSVDLDPWSAARFARMELHT